MQLSMSRGRLVAALLPLTVILMPFLLASCAERRPSATPVAAPADLVEHSREFRQEVVRVTDRIHVAVGFGLANSILIEGDDGVVVVDAMESVRGGQEVMDAFRKITDKPVRALIYTHNHTDHVFGARSMAGQDAPLVIAHEDMPVQLDKIATVIRPIIEKRSYRMFGNLLGDGEVINCGIGPSLHIDRETELGVIRPDTVFRDSLWITVAGVDLRLYHAPGETPDQLLVWLPGDRALLCADNVYKAFPNLYTIRGTANRDLRAWWTSIDAMRRFPAEHLIPSHTRPVSGAEHIAGILTDYRDAIQFVHDQTVRYMNLGYTPREIVELVRLPEHLATSPYLQEFYGRVDWTVRSVFTGYLGWFDGNPSTLLPLPVKEEATRMAALAGGREGLLRACRDAVESGDYQWGLQLTDHLLALDGDTEAARTLRVQCLEALAGLQSNPNSRNYLLTAARELEGLENEGLITPGLDMVHAIPMESVFRGMATFLNAEKARDVNKTVVFSFTDTGEEYSVIVRRGVAEIRAYAVPEPDHTLTTTATVWKEIAAELRKPVPAFLSGKVKVDGGQIAFVRFMDLFDR